MLKRSSNRTFMATSIIISVQFNLGIVLSLSAIMLPCEENFNNTNGTSEVQSLKQHLLFKTTTLTLRAVVIITSRYRISCNLGLSFGNLKILGPNCFYCLNFRIYCLCLLYSNLNKWATWAHHLKWIINT